MKDPLAWFDSPLKMAMGLLTLLGVWAWFSHFKKERRKHVAMAEPEFPIGYFKHNLAMMERRLEMAHVQDWCWELERLVDHALHFNLKIANKNDAGFGDRVDQFIEVDSSQKEEWLELKEKLESANRLKVASSVENNREILRLAKSVLLNEK
jgi:hypothetical protein